MASAALLGLAGWLLASAGAKAVSPTAAIAALREVGLAKRPARIVAVLATTVEAVVGAAILIWPAEGAVQIACLTLFGLFAAGGAVAVASGRTIECGCMGALKRSTLGWGQIGQFVLITVTLGLVHAQPPSWSPGSGAAALFALVVSTGFVLLAFAAPSWWRTRRARVSLASVAPYMHHAEARDPGAAEAHA